MNADQHGFVAPPPRSGMKQRHKPGDREPQGKAAPEDSRRRLLLVVVLFEKESWRTGDTINSRSSRILLLLNRSVVIRAFFRVFRVQGFENVPPPYFLSERRAPVSFL